MQTGLYGTDNDDIEISALGLSACCVIVIRKICLFL
jgi:hypothetical protein